MSSRYFRFRPCSRQYFAVLYNTYKLFFPQSFYRNSKFHWCILHTVKLVILTSYFGNRIVDIKKLNLSNNKKYVHHLSLRRRVITPVFDSMDYVCSYHASSFVLAFTYLSVYTLKSTGKWQNFRPGYQEFSFCLHPSQEFFSAFFYWLIGFIDTFSCLLLLILFLFKGEGHGGTFSWIFLLLIYLFYYFLAKRCINIWIHEN